MRHVLQLFAQKFVKTPKLGDLFEKFHVLAKSMIFRVFSRNEAFFASSCQKDRQNTETWSFVRKVESFGQVDDFSCFSAN